MASHDIMWQNITPLHSPPTRALESPKTSDLSRMLHLDKLTGKTLDLRDARKISSGGLWNESSVASMLREQETSVLALNNAYSELEPSFMEGEAQRKLAFNKSYTRWEARLRQARELSNRRHAEEAEKLRQDIRAFERKISQDYIKVGDDAPFHTEEEKQRLGTDDHNIRHGQDDPIQLRVPVYAFKMLDDDDLVGNTTRSSSTMDLDSVFLEGPDLYPVRPKVTAQSVSPFAGLYLETIDKILRKLPQNIDELSGEERFDIFTQQQDRHFMALLLNN
ncbi:hypothetical protein H0H92_007528 [Tricholoma furcatifolium]|nr:hypothetical protein H0H92_007528 [Tricholoma furcatifolium]